jgi:hypothetical protein
MSANGARRLRSSAWVVDARQEPRVSEGMQRGGRSEINACIESRLR